MLILIYADDVVLLAYFQLGLQMLLDMGHSCEHSGLPIDVPETKLMAVSIVQNLKVCSNRTDLEVVERNI